MSARGWMLYYDRQEIETLRQRDRSESRLLGAVQSNRERVMSLQEVEDILVRHARPCA